jgi:hypothetical protein
MANPDALKMRIKSLLDILSLMMVSLDSEGPAASHEDPDDITCPNRAQP